jgi:DNA-binding NtrC family response regulator
VLLVDREALYRWFVSESLRGCDVEVVPCGSMEDAASVLRGPLALDLLIVDGEMLEGRDAEALHAMCADADAPPCLVLDSGGALSTSRLDAVTVADKPVDTAAVIALVTRHLRREVPAA